jgi:hypothetical protein
MQTFTSNLTPDAQRMIRSRGLGSLADRMGIEFLELSAEHSVATSRPRATRSRSG